MKRFLISKIRKEFFELKNTKQDCQEYIKMALEENGFKDIKKGELGGHLDELSKNTNDIMSIIREQEKILERKSIYFILPKFFFNSLTVKRRTKEMKKAFIDFVQEKSEYSFDEFIKKINNNN